VLAKSGGFRRSRLFDQGLRKVPPSVVNTNGNKPWN
jgi:hypothetical protein